MVIDVPLLVNQAKCHILALTNPYDTLAMNRVHLNIIIHSVLKDAGAIRCCESFCL